MIKGEVTLVFRDVNTGEITKEIKENNVVTNWTLANTCANGASQTDGSGAGDGDWGRFGWRVYIGNWDQPSDRTFHYMHDIYAGGETEAGIAQPRLLSGNVGEGSSFAYYYEHQQRFTPPASTRTIRTIGIQREDQSSGSLNYQKPVECMAYLSLSTPCTQTPTETLDVFYRIIWNNPTPSVSGMSTEQMQILAQRHMNNDTQSGSLPPTGSVWRPEWPSRWAQYFYQGKKMVPNTSGEILSAARLAYRNETGVTAGYGGYYARAMTLGITISDSLGRIYGSIAHRDNSSDHKSAFWNPTLKDFSTDSPVGNIFPHSLSATGPFYQSGGLAAGAGTVSLDGSGWTNPDLNKLLQIEITTSGVLGVSDYRLHVMNTTGFIQNTYKHSEVAIPFLNDDNTGFDGAPLFESGAGGFIGDRGPHMMPYGDSKTELVVYAYDWLGKLDIMTGSRVRFHSGSTPAFNGTSINQLVVVPTPNAGSLTPGDIWVADETGLYRVHQDDSTIDHFDSTHPNLTTITTDDCYGVTFTPGRIWALFNGGLAYTTDNGTSFTVYDGTSSPTFTSADWTRIWFIQGDPVNANHHLGVAYNEEPGFPTTNRCDLKLDWWDPVAGYGNAISQLHRTTATGSTDPWRRIDIFRVFECAPDGSAWGCSHHEANSNNPAFFAFNSTAASQTFPSYSSATMNQRRFFGWAKDLAGVYAMVVCWYDFNNAYFGFCQQDGTSTRSDVCNTNDLAEDSTRNWYNCAGDEGLKCIIHTSGMLVYSTVGNCDSSAYRFYGMRPAWQDEDDPYGGVGKFVNFEEYGWNGAAWVKDHPGNKPTHASSDALIEGLTISFDDNSGADPFVDDDYYTVAVCDGIMADGATEFDHKYMLYYKRAYFGETNVEGGGVLPAVTADHSHNMTNAERDSLIDVNNVTSTDGYLNGTSSNWYCRINEIHTDEAELRFRMDTSSGYGEAYVGFADATKIGTTPITGTDIDYAFKMSAGVLGGTNGIKVEAVSNGVVVAVIDDGSQGFADDTLASSNNGRGNFNRNNEDYIYFELRRDPGTTDVKLYYRNKLVHTFAGASSNLVASFRSSSASIDVRNVSMRTTLNNYVVELGSSTFTSGFFDPNFYAIDLTDPGRPSAAEVLINATPVTTILYNDTTTVLATGEVSILDSGYVRYSAADTGKTLTISRYNVLLNE